MPIKSSAKDDVQGVVRVTFVIFAIMISSDTCCKQYLCARGYIRDEYAYPRAGGNIEMPMHTVHLLSSHDGFLKKCCDN